MKTKQRLLMGFCVIILLMSAAAVTIQAWGLPDDISKDFIRCEGYCKNRYTPGTEYYQICFEACLFGAAGNESPEN